MRLLENVFKAKLLTALSLLAVSVLLLGTVRIGNSRQSRQMKTLAEKETFRREAKNLAPALPAHLREQWLSIAESSPELCIKVCAGRLEKEPLCTVKPSGR